MFPTKPRLALVTTSFLRAQSLGNCIRWFLGMLCPRLRYLIVFYTFESCVNFGL